MDRRCRHGNSLCCYFAVTLVWTVPDVRTDGQQFQPDEVEYYEVQRNGELYTVTTENHVDAGRNGVYRVRCYDRNDLASDWSNELRVKIKGRRK